MIFGKSLWQRLKEKFIRPKNRWSIALLNTTQFTTVLNDNIYKFTLIFFLIQLQGIEKASAITSIAGAIYVIPFLLFSSVAGLIADRFSKQKLLILMKVFEMLILGLALLSFSLKSIVGSYGLLFLLSLHSALFGPSKYGIIPELVPKDMIGSANGKITSFTYIAIIAGTFLASFLAEITQQNYFIILLVCFGFAFVGFITSWRIPATPAQGSKTKLLTFFLKEIACTWRFSRQIPHLSLAIMGAAFFLFIGGFTQLNIIPFAIDALHLSDIAGGYLFLTTALGIALGSLIAGKTSRQRAELGTCCLAGFVIGGCMLVLGLAPHNLALDIAILVLLGFAGGIFIVPFETFMQLASPDGKRGQVIATANFFSFLGVLVASLLLYLFSQILHLSACAGFNIVGAITLLFSLFLVFALSDLLVHFVCRKWTKWRKIQLDTTALIQKDRYIILTKGLGWKDLFPILSLNPSIHLLYPLEKFSGKTLFLKLFSSIDFASSQLDVQDLEEIISSLYAKNKIPVLAYDRETEWKVFFLPDECSYFIKNLDITVFLTKRTNQTISFKPIENKT